MQIFVMDEMKKEKNSKQLSAKKEKEKPKKRRRAFKLDL